MNLFNLFQAFNNNNNFYFYLIFNIYFFIYFFNGKLKKLKLIIYFYIFPIKYFMIFINIFTPFHIQFSKIFFFSKNEISEIFVRPISKYSNFSSLDIGVKSLIFLQPSKSNDLIFLLFSMNEISEIFV